VATKPEEVMTEHTGPTGQRIVVGVDGSTSSREALRWAVRQAELTGGRVEAIMAWQSPTLVGLGGSFFEVEVGRDDTRIRAAAGRVLREAVAEAMEASPGVPVKAEIGEGSAAQLLLDAALGAGLVVVGSRGYGGITGALLGSVGHALAQHSPCPVVIIRGIG
jgi:nucleotide-binding universal stress UspA family protein